MNEASLGSPNVVVRIVGLTRTQWAGLLGGVTLVLDATRRPHLAFGEVIVAVLVGGAGVARWRHHGFVEALGVLVSYLTRSRWTVVRWRRDGDAVAINARGSARVALYDAAFHGRLDLAGEAEERWRDGTAMLERLATRATPQRVSWHRATTTFVAMPPDASPPSPFLTPRTEPDDLAASSWVYEHWRYLEFVDGVACVLRLVSDHDARGPLAWSLDDATITMVCEVIPNRVARRRVARRTHAATTDAALARRMGFRHSASAALRFSRTQRHEQLVAQGRALVRVAVFVVVRATDPAALARARQRVRDRAEQDGFLLETGFGRQAEWWCASLPGAPRW